MAIAFTKVALPYGWLGNMAPFPVEYDGKRWRTTEALFQALRFADDGVREQIRASRSPMGAKMIAKKHKARMVVAPQSEQDLANMLMVLRLKLEQHPGLKQELLATGEEMLIEDCAKRPGASCGFWGAAKKGRTWEGKNTLGTLWMKVRDEMRAKLSR